MTRPHRIPGTRSHTWRRAVFTGNDPTAALLRAIQELQEVKRGQIWSVGVAHDDECPAVDVGPMSACTCEIVELTAKRAA